MIFKKYKFLTDQEQRVFDCYLDGMTQQEIADYLQCALSTVKYHTKSLHKKFGVKNTLSLVALHYKSLLDEEYPYDKQTKRKN